MFTTKQVLKTGQSVHHNMSHIGKKVIFRNSETLRSYSKKEMTLRSNSQREMTLRSYIRREMTILQTRDVTDGPTDGPTDIRSLI